MSRFERLLIILLIVYIGMLVINFFTLRSHAKQVEQYRIAVEQAQKKPFLIEVKHDYGER